MLWVYLCMGLFGSVVGQDAVDNRTVTIEQGPVRGYKAPGTNVFTFYGVPYAVEPTGTEKFRAPLPAPTWSDIFEAVEDFIVCPQPGFGRNHENCLITNLYVPDTTETDLPVLVNVHGGGFQVGFGNSDTPFGLLENKDMIVINFNYRLGAHGFLCLGTNDVPGNAGMKDQLSLLRWVKKNIEAFGGNPNDITIVGCSAGGVSVDLLRVVNVTDGLFNKVITESGSSVGTWSVQVDPIENAKIYARVLGFDNVDNITALEEFYKTAPFEILYLKIDEIMNRVDSTILFVPCVEKDIGVERFLEEAPVNIIKSGLNKVLPTLYGFAEREGLMQIGYFEDWSVRMNANFVEFVPADLQFESEEEKSVVAQRIKNFYFGEGAITEDSRVPFIDFISDVLFIYSMLRSVKLHTTTREGDSFYIYEYSFINELTQNYPGGVRGANHCDQVIAVFDEEETNLEQEYIEIKKIMRNIYVNFITTGTPIVNGSPLPIPWIPANANRDPHLAIGANITLEGPTYAERVALWDEIYENYYRSPIPPDNVHRDTAANRTVTIEQGPVRGYKAQGTNIFAFYGIPYAIEPTGTEKFRAPLPAPTWSDIFEAVDDFIVCPQPGFGRNHENCLITNIYVPDTAETDLPVLVNVHGGGFQVGFGNSDTPFGLLENKDMIVINFNYRLGAHGFLCLGTNDVPGNAGMKDQLSLLRWVKKNIEAFGGNPNDITIMGCSAGGASVDLLRVVNVTDGLFNKVIAESGSSVGTWSVQVDPIENAKIYARVLGFENVDNITALEEFYKTASFEILYLKIDEIMNRVDSSILFVPCVEKDIGVERFIEEAPVNIIKSGLNKVLPTLYGFAEREGLMYIGYFEDWSVRMNASFVEFVPADLDFESDQEKSEVAQRIKNFYFGEGAITEDSRVPFIDFISDVLFIYSMLRSVKLHTTTREGDSFYIYEYSFINELTQNYPGGVRGANHCEQIIAVFDEDETNLEHEYIEMKKFMRNIYVNFITTGTPIVNGSPLPIPWIPANANRDPHLAIGANITLEGPTYAERVALWDEIYENYYRSPIPPDNVHRDTAANRTVTIEQGPVRGYKAQGTNIFAFYGIPYAIEPTDTEKFRAPLPAPTWSDIFEAVDDFIVCPQPGFGRNHENCLITNIYVPDTAETDLPVLVNVHGGAFQFGFGNSDKPFGLLENKDMIVINFNYRLGAHGFLCLGTEDVPGNAGMKDQLALLRWVKKNIEAFGGNPNDITIVGCSAGGVSIDLLRVVNVTDGLFNKVITESGSSVGTWSVQVDPIENAKIYARVLGFENVDNIIALEEFYKTASFELLYSRIDEITSRVDSTVLFVPCVEKDIGVERFLEEAPVNIIKKGVNKVLPTLYGFAEREGLMQIGYFEDWSVRMNANFVEFVPADLQFESEEEKSVVAQRIKNFYFGEGAITEDSRVPFIDFISDVLFIYSMLRSVKLHTTTREGDSFYIYEYSFINELKQNYPGGVRGANHCEQIMAVFDEDETNLEHEYIEMKKFMRNIYVNFITTGTPIVNGSPLPVSWIPANANRDPHLAIGANITLEGPAYEDRVAFWDEIYESYYRSPIPPDNGAVFNIVSYLWIICSVVITITL